MAYVPLSGPLKPITRDEKAVQTKYVYDEEQKKTQSEINKELLQKSADLYWD